MKSVVEVVDAAGKAGKMASSPMTTANKITILRILLIPFFVVEVLYYVQAGNPVHRWLAIATFAVAAICDGVDGYVARRFNQRSELGAILDPLADKLLLASGIILLSFDHSPYLHAIPLWLTGTVLGRDFLLVLGILVIQFMVGKVVVRPRAMGKVATVLQMVVVMWVLLKFEGRWLPWVTVAAALCTGISGLWYLYDGTKQLSSHPTSSPSPAAARKPG